MTHEIYFLVVAGNDFYKINKPDIPQGTDIPAELAFVRAIIEKETK